MKRFLFSLMFAFIMFVTYGQNIYRGKSSYSSDIVANVKGNIVYKGSSRYQSSAMFNFDGKYIRYGTSHYDSDIIATYVDGKLYQGKGTYTSDIIATYSRGVWYEGNGQYKALCNYDRKYVRSKKSKYDSDILLTTSSYVHTAILAMLVLF